MHVNNIYILCYLNHIRTLPNSQGWIALCRILNTLAKRVKVLGPFPHPCGTTVPLTSASAIHPKSVAWWWCRRSGNGVGGGLLELRLPWNETSSLNCNPRNPSLPCPGKYGVHWPQHLPHLHNAFLDPFVLFGFSPSSLDQIDILRWNNSSQKDQFVTKYQSCFDG